MKQEAEQPETVVRDQNGEEAKAGHDDH